jgi:hypothetical protein
MRFRLLLEWKGWWDAKDEKELKASLWIDVSWASFFLMSMAVEFGQHLFRIRTRLLTRTFRGNNAMSSESMAMLGSTGAMVGVVQPMAGSKMRLGGRCRTSFATRSKFFYAGDFYAPR